MNTSLYTPREIQLQLAERVKALRIAGGFTQKEIAERAGVSYGTYKLFEQEGRISLDRLLSIAVVIGRPGGALALFPEEGSYASLDELERLDAARKTVKRSRYRSKRREADR